jgi:hypothetical protein
MPITLDGSSGITAGAYSGIDQADLATPLNASGSAPLYVCRAWVNFNGTGTVAIRASGNVTSITDNGTGYYTINLTTAMPDANYATTGSVRRNATNDASISAFAIRSGVAPTTTAVAIMTHDALGSTVGAIDVDYVNVSVHR